MIDIIDCDEYKTGIIDDGDDVYCNLKIELLEEEVARLKKEKEELEKMFRNTGCKTEK